MKGLYDNEMKLEFLSKSSNEAFARITVAAFASQLDPTIEEISDIKTAVSEAVTNCIIHAYEDTDGIVKIVTRLINNMVEIEISGQWKRNRKYKTCKTTSLHNKSKFRKVWHGFYN